MKDHQGNFGLSMTACWRRSYEIEPALSVAQGVCPEARVCKCGRCITLHGVISTDDRCALGTLCEAAAGRDGVLGGPNRW